LFGSNNLMSTPALRDELVIMKQIYLNIVIKE
jgi:hypothetical protein